MSLPAWTSSFAGRVAIGALVAALALDGWATARAVRIDPVPADPPRLLDVSRAFRSGTQRQTTDIDAAVAADPFSPSRTAPSERYQLPWESDEAKVEVTRPIVLGTAISLDGRSFATCQLGTDRPRIVHVGDKLGDYTVKSIARGSVVFRTPSGTSLDVQALKSGM